MKKANLFIIDAILAMVLLFSFIIYTKPFFAATLEHKDRLYYLENYAEQSIILLRGIRVADLDSETQQSIPLNYQCMDCKLSKQIAILMVNQEEEIVKELAKATLSELIPQNYGYSLILSSSNAQDEIIIKDYPEKTNIATQKTLISGVKEPQESSDVMLLYIKVWN